MRTTRRLARLLFLLVVMAVPARATAVAQNVPDEFTNLKVLPENISKRDLVKVMRGFAGALGVRCSRCHVGDDPEDLSTFDFAADDKDEKLVARGMLTMVSEINDKLIPDAGRTDHEQVQCVTCHRGVRFPVPLGDLILRTIDARGTDAAVQRYKDLRDEFYGRSAYDFGAESLNSVAQAMARQHNDPEGALTFIRLNIEVNPDDASPHAIEGQILSQMGDKEGALASLERALELDPGNEAYQRLLDRLKKP